METESSLVERKRIRRVRHYFVQICFMLLVGKSSLAQGGLVDVGGYELQYRKLGAGDPAVVFLNGGTATMEYWDIVVEEIATTTMTMTYERAGHSRSGMGREPRHGINMAHELKALLEALDIPEPCIFVAHSAGTMTARIFASLYPETVAGMILLDPGDKDVLDAFGEEHLNGQDLINWTNYWDRTWSRLAQRTDGFGKETQMKTATLQQMVDFPLPSNMKLIVASAMDKDRPHDYIKDYDEEIIDLFYAHIREYHQSLIRDMAHGRHVPVADATHVIHRDRPDLVVALVNDLLESSSSSQS